MREIYERRRAERMADHLMQFNDPGESPARREQAARAFWDWYDHGPLLRGLF